jgi:hypothetical protein
MALGIVAVGGSAGGHGSRTGDELKADVCSVREAISPVRRGHHRLEQSSRATRGRFPLGLQRQERPAQGPRPRVRGRKAASASAGLERTRRREPACKLIYLCYSTGSTDWLAMDMQRCSASFVEIRSKWC